MDIFEQRARQDAQMEITRREMLRKSLDTIRIFNPLDHTFVYKWDGFTHSIKSNETKDVPRYLANHYFKKIADYMIGQQMMREGEELLAMREKQFGKKFLNMYEENKEVWDRTPKLNDPELQKEVLDLVILGVVEEYGYDLAEEPEIEAKSMDYRSQHDQIFATMDKRITPQFTVSVAGPGPAIARPQLPFKRNSVPAKMEEITSE